MARCSLFLCRWCCSTFCKASCSLLFTWSLLSCLDALLLHFIAAAALSSSASAPPSASASPSTASTPAASCYAAAISSAAAAPCSSCVDLYSTISDFRGPSAEPTPIPASTWWRRYASDFLQPPHAWRLSPFELQRPRDNLPFEHFLPIAGVKVLLLNLQPMLFLGLTPKSGSSESEGGIDEIWVDSGGEGLIVGEVHIPLGEINI